MKTSLLILLGLISAQFSYAQATLEIEHPAVTLVRSQTSETTLVTDVKENEYRNEVRYRQEWVSVPYIVQVPYTYPVTQYRQVWQCGGYPGYSPCRYVSVPYTVWMQGVRNETRYRQELRDVPYNERILVRSRSLPVQIHLVNASMFVPGPIEQFEVKLSSSIDNPVVTVTASSLTNQYRLQRTESSNGIYVVTLEATQVADYNHYVQEQMISGLRLLGNNQEAVIEFTDASPENAAMTTSYELKLYGSRRGENKILGSVRFTRGSSIYRSIQRQAVPVRSLSGITRHEMRRFLDQGDSVRLVLEVTRTSSLLNSSGIQITKISNRRD